MYAYTDLIDLVDGGQPLRDWEMVHVLTKEGPYVLLLANILNRLLRGARARPWKAL